MSTSVPRNAKPLRTPPKQKLTSKEYLEKLSKRARDTIKAKRANNKNKIRSKRQMRSFSNPEKTYTVTSESCTCPDFRFRRRMRGELCKHIRKFRYDFDSKKAQSICREKDLTLQPKKKKQPCKPTTLKSS